MTGSVAALAASSAEQLKTYRAQRRVFIRQCASIDKPQPSESTKKMERGHADIPVRVYLTFGILADQNVRAPFASATAAPSLLLVSSSLLLWEQRRRSVAWAVAASHQRRA